MATDEILEALRQIAREKSVDRKLLIETLEAGLLSAARKRYATAADVHVAFDDATGEIRVRVYKKVVQVAIDLAGEIDYEEAVRIDPGVRLGATVPVEVPMAEMGRNAIQAAKQVLVQRVREAERENVYQEYIDRKGQIVSGSVSQSDRGNVIVKIGRTEGILTSREQIPFRDRFKIGDPIRALLYEVDKAQKGPMLLLSRTHAEFARRLFENEVPEIFERVVEIRDIAREPGSRTKITVVSHDDRVDPVGACVGMKGSRVQNIVRELGGERIDIVPWSPDPKILISRALNPARVLDVLLNEAERRATVVVSDDQLSLAIGKGGQNVRLAHRLTGWSIDLKSQSQVELEQTGGSGLPDVELEDLQKELGPKLVEKLIKAGKETLQDVLRTSPEDLMEIPGIAERTAARLLSIAREVLDRRAAELEAGGEDVAAGEAAPELLEEEAEGMAEEPAEEAGDEIAEEAGEAGEAGDEPTPETAEEAAQEMAEEATEEAVDETTGDAAEEDAREGAGRSVAAESDSEHGAGAPAAEAAEDAERETGALDGAPPADGAERSAAGSAEEGREAGA